jgi:8-oxo-dGTP pyrophosphatase MutT (NUDIX family)
MDPRPGWGVRLASAARLLGEHTPAAVVDREWPTGRVRLSAYVGGVTLPTEIPGRTRVLLTDGEKVLVTWDRSGHPDCLPGGGIEPGETPLDAAKREVWEETGWHLDGASVEELGWIHVESMTASAAYLPFPHPDTFMTVFTARPSGREVHPGSWTDVEGFIERSAFVPLAELPPEVQQDPISSVFLGLVLG